MFQILKGTLVNVDFYPALQSVENLLHSQRLSVTLSDLHSQVLCALMTAVIEMRETELISL